jgi:hypothetical protein
MIFISAATLAACNNVEIGSTKDVGDEAIYADYKVWGEEGKETVTVLLQYRMGGPDGTTLVLEKPGGVAIDSIPLAVDSAGISGAYYEGTFPLATFTGNHVIEYSSSEGKKHRTPFSFSPFSFKNEPPETVPMKPVTFYLTGLPPEPTILRIVMTDTAFATDDVNTEIAVEMGELTISAQMWQSLKPGPVVLEIYREEEKQLSTFSKEGGIMTINYGLKRELHCVLPKDTLSRN